MIRYRITRRLALGLRFLQDLLAVGTLAAAGAASATASRARASAYAFMERKEQQAGNRYAAARVAVERARQRQEDAYDDYINVVEDHADLRHEIETEVI